MLFCTLLGSAQSLEKPLLPDTSFASVAHVGGNTTIKDLVCCDS